VMAWSELNCIRLEYAQWVFYVFIIFFVNTMMNLPVSEKQCTLRLPNFKLYAEDLVTWTSLIT
jgi:hypothetical protein